MPGDTGVRHGDGELTISVDTIAQILGRRPAVGLFREQLFWLVDLIYACKSSGDNALAAEAQVVEDALGSLGEYLETGDTVSLSRATARVEHFARLVKAAVAAGKGDPEP